MGMPALVTVVDDDESVRDALPDLLNELGFAVRTFSSAEAYLASDCPEHSNCLVADVAMPGMSGIDLQRVLTERRPELPIIFITGQADEKCRVQAFERGAVAYLLKPFADTDLLEAIKVSLERGR
jgi:FixJ family two-component response regulator